MYFSFSNKSIHQGKNGFLVFGSLIPDRNASSAAYRYGFQGQEKDDEIKGEGNSYDFGARMLDPRVGRWFARDPQSINFPFESNYVYVSNNPLIYKDPTGEAKILTLIYTNAKQVKSSHIQLLLMKMRLPLKLVSVMNILPLRNILGMILI
ncbi:RHS repeat domain-containing protein [Flavobacterium sp. NRK F10]|uniref:RHS repeat domain-containing protein n=1 Tax=Flavobacterium sp. NRK F10 TaxID=2954931 RepID=UPI0035B2136E